MVRSTIADSTNRIALKHNDRRIDLIERENVMMLQSMLASIVAWFMRINANVMRKLLSDLAPGGSQLKFQLLKYVFKIAYSFMCLSFGYMWFWAIAVMVIGA